MLHKILSHATLSIQRNLSNMFTIFHSPQLALAPTAPMFEIPSASLEPDSSASPSPTIADCLWLAVPKRKVSRSKKRMKTTLQKRIKVKHHVIVDSRTGEMTMRHRLPHNWKRYVQEE